MREFIYLKNGVEVLRKPYESNLDCDGRDALSDGVDYDMVAFKTSNSTNQYSAHDKPFTGWYKLNGAFNVIDYKPIPKFYNNKPKFKKGDIVYIANWINEYKIERILYVDGVSWNYDVERTGLIGVGGRDIPESHITMKDNLMVSNASIMRDENGNPLNGWTGYTC